MHESGTVSADEPSWYPYLRMQISMGLISGSSALYLATIKSGQEQAVYAAAGAAMLAMTPFTIVFLLPTNNRLTSPAKKEDAEVRLIIC